MQVTPNASCELLMQKTDASQLLRQKAQTTKALRIQLSELPEITNSKRANINNIDSFKEEICLVLKPEPNNRKIIDKTSVEVMWRKV